MESKIDRFESRDGRYRGILGLVGAYVELESALQATPVDGREFVSCRGYVPLPFRIISQGSFALLWVRSKIALAKSIARGETSAKHAFPLLESPNVQWKGGYGNVGERFNIEELVPWFCVEGVLDVDAFEVVIWGAGEDLVLVRVKTLMTNQIILTRECLIAGRPITRPLCSNDTQNALQSSQRCMTHCPGHVGVGT